MCLAVNGIVPPKEWEHDPGIKDENNHTVCYFLFNN